VAKEGFRLFLRVRNKITVLLHVSVFLAPCTTVGLAVKSILSDDVLRSSLAGTICSRLSSPLYCAASCLHLAARLKISA
jgi:hypothetical protein